jgi:hypothetical protein
MLLKGSYNSKMGHYNVPAEVIRLVAVGLCTLNQVDPYPITYNLSKP